MIFLKGVFFKGLHVDRMSLCAGTCSSSIHNRVTLDTLETFDLFLSLVSGSLGLIPHFFTLTTSEMNFLMGLWMSLWTEAFSTSVHTRVTSWKLETSDLFSSLVSYCFMSSQLLTYTLTGSEVEYCSLILFILFCSSLTLSSRSFIFRRVIFHPSSRSSIFTFDKLLLNYEHSWDSSILRSTQLACQLSTIWVPVYGL